MDAERALLTKLIQTGAADRAISRGIEADDFADKDVREVYETVVDHMSKYRATPSVEVIREEHPDFALEVAQDPLEYLMDRFVKQVKRRRAIELGRDYRDAIDDPDRVGDIEVIALEMARELTEVVPSPRISRYSDAPDRIAEYERRKEEGDIYGLLMGVPSFDELTLGIQQHELVMVMAFLGMGKSTLMQRIFYEVYLQGKTPLMISLEMDAQTLLRRFDGMATNVRYWALKALELQDSDKEKWEKVAERADADRHERDILIVDDIKGASVDKVMAEAIRYKPDLVGIDYLGLMSAGRQRDISGWEKAREVSIGLKANARLLRIPHLVATQGNAETGKGNISVHNFGEFYGIARDCDLALSMHQDDDMKARNEMNLYLIKNRDGMVGQTTVHWELDVMKIFEPQIADKVKKRMCQDQS